jgi:hypothetical protein
MSQTITDSQLRRRRVAQPYYGKMTRRSVFVGTIASLICLPGFARISGLMTAIRATKTPANVPDSKGSVYLGFAGSLRLFWMEKALERGWDDEQDGSTFGGISETEARAYVADIRSRGTLSPPPPSNSADGYLGRQRKLTATQPRPRAQRL